MTDGADDMAFALVDDGFPDHAKTLALMEHDGWEHAVCLWTLCLSWAAKHIKDADPGRIPALLPRRYMGPRGTRAAALLVKVGLWDVDDDQAFRIHDFAEHQQIEQRQNRAAAASRAARSRWSATQPDLFGADTAEQLADAQGNASRSAQGNASGSASRNAITKPNQTKPIKDLSALARFDEFYAAYPRRAKRPEAERAWAKAVTRADPDKIITAVRKYAADPNLPAAQYIPQPARWLNQDSWNDDPLPARGEQRPGRAETADMATPWEGRPR